MFRDLGSTNLLAQAILVVGLSFLFSTNSFSQKPNAKPLINKAFSHPKVSDKQLVDPNINTEKQSFTPRAVDFPSKISPTVSLTAERLGEDEQPIWLEFTYPMDETNPESSISQLLNLLKEKYGEYDENLTWEIITTETDDVGMMHFKLQRYYKGVPIHNEESFLHADGNKLKIWNGRWSKIEELPFPNPSISKEEALSTIKTWFKKQEDKVFEPEKRYIGLPEDANKPELVVFNSGNNYHLVWKVIAMPDAFTRKEVFIDAHSGLLLDHFSSICQAHHNCSHDHGHSNNANVMPPNMTSGNDLLGQSRTLRTYSSGGRNYMLDGSRSMFNSSASSIPNDPVGAIWTLDGGNDYPDASFNPGQISTTSNVWTDQKAVSAHFNAGQAYEYFNQVHSRNSIDGNGGNIISFINITDENGRDFDNAFWNGQYMFYGNGNQAFAFPLMRSLDVSGHEMTHGVIQNSANLEYRNESGALNESFADVFGVLIEWGDFQLGEDVVNSNIFRSGALRDMSDPHNGGNSLNDPGYQPERYSERYRGSDDNGGVHINSGIPNFAFFKIASRLGKDKVEEIFYRALTVGYLTRSSRFEDFRYAIARAAKDLFGTTEENICHDACDEVEIPGERSSSGGDDDRYENDLALNPGNEFLLCSDEDRNDIYLIDANGANRISLVDPRSKMSVTDNGTEVVYVNDQDQVNYLFLDYNSGQVDELTLIESMEWDFVALSKDGSKLAAVRNVTENIIYVYDFDSRRWGEFTLFNPSFTEGVSTGDVKYADVLEWDYSGQYIMYDAFNELQSPGGSSLNYWDIGFIQVWDNSRNDFDNGENIEKLFSSLPQGVSVGNPTFSKNSPYIVAIDVIDENNNQNYLMGVNIESGESEIIFTNDRLSYPSYGRQDQFVYFDTEGQNGDNYRVAAIGLNDDKISTNNDLRNAVGAARWGVIFSNGERDLSSSEETLQDIAKVYPNPIDQFLNFKMESDADINIFNALGQKMIDSKGLTKGQHFKIDCTAWNSGVYFVEITVEGKKDTRKVIKE